MAKTIFTTREEFDKFVSKIPGYDIDPEFIPTGSLALDMAIGTGGIPTKRVSQIWGKKGSGKTSIIIDGLIRSLLTIFTDKVTFLVDMEFSTTDEYVKEILEEDYSDRLVILRFKTLNEALDTCLELLNSPFTAGIIFDSIGASPLSTEVTKKGKERAGAEAVDKRTFASYAGVLTNFSKRALPYLVENNSVFLFVNQVRQDIENQWNEYRFPGGEAYRHSLALDIFVTPREAKNPSDGIGLIYGNEVDKKGKPLAIGKYISFRIAWNKLAPPMRSGDIPFLFGKGIDKVREIVEFTTFAGILDKRGAYLSFEGESIGQGKKKAIEFLEVNPEILDKIKKKCYTLLEVIDDKEVINEED